MIELFLALCTDMLAGLKKLAVELKITQVTPAEFESQLDDTTDTQDNYEAARSAKKAASDAVKPTDAAVFGFLMTARNAFIKSFGTRWNTMWAQAGWTDHSTAIPRKSEAARSRVKAVGSFLAKNPSYEVAALNVTSKIAGDVYKAAVDADGDVMTAKTAQAATKVSRKEAEKGMRVTARMLIGILNGLLGKGRSALERIRPGDAVDEYDAGTADECDGATGCDGRDPGLV